MTPEEAVEFVKTHGVVLESARGPVPNLAATVAGEQVKGSWWSHPKSHEIFQLTRAVRDSADILVCRLIDKKISYVHRRLWPAVVRLADELDPKSITAIREVHTQSGLHELNETPFLEWVSEEVIEAAEKLSREEAMSQLDRFIRQ